MSYATAKEVLERHPRARVAEVTDPKGNRVQTKRVEVACGDASAEIDGYLGKVYKLPLAHPPPVLKRLAIDIAVYRLMSLLPKESVEDARRRYEDAIKWLEDLVEGLVSLDGAIEDAGAAEGNVLGHAPAARAFDGAGLKGYL